MFKPSNAFVAELSVAEEDDLKVFRKSSNASERDVSLAAVQVWKVILTLLCFIIDRRSVREESHDASTSYKMRSDL